MGKQVWVTSSLLLGVTTIILLGFVLDGGENRQGLTLMLSSSGSHRSRWMKADDLPETMTYKTNQFCKPQQNVVFIKTHKTASSTTAGVFDLYAYRNNLTVAVPPNNRPYMHRTKPFHQNMMAKVHESASQWQKDVGFNVFSSHARYNRPQMDAVVHNAKYITVLRDPSRQFVSAFVFFHFDTRFQRKFDRLGRVYSNVLEEFMRNPTKYMKLMDSHPLRHVIHNQQFFDLGLDTKYADDWDTIDATISRFDKELDLVMITEYYDESLILLRDLLCWSTEDIVYVRRNVHNSTNSIDVSKETRRKIRKWNAADTQLYEHFNQTLWHRIAEYGPTFDEELRQFRTRLQSVTGQEAGSHRKLVNKMVQIMKSNGILAE